MNFFLLFCLALALSPLGSIRIGGPNAEAKYNLASWVAMLFAAGIGIGIMFYGVLEPMNHALRLPFDMEGLGIEETQSVAMAATLYHWAFHPWAVYAVVGLSLSFSAITSHCHSSCGRRFTQYSESGFGAGLVTSWIS